MDKIPSEQPDVQQLFTMHDHATAAFRAELLGRSAGEVLYDEYLLSQLRKGKPFKIAIRKANQKFPTEALDSYGENMAQLEAHYRFFLRMEEIDGYRQKIEVADRKIAKVDVQIEEVLRRKQHGE